MIEFMNTFSDVTIALCFFIGWPVTLLLARMDGAKSSKKQIEYLLEIIKGLREDLRHGTGYENAYPGRYDQPKARTSHNMGLHKKNSRKQL